MVMVTGASGHIGGNLVRALLADDRKVRVMVRKDKRAVEGLNMEMVTGDVLDYGSVLKAFEGCETVYHLGGVISVGDEKNDNVFDVNVNGTRNVVRACLEHKVKRLVHFSSIHAIHGLNADGLMDESCSYSESKECLPYNRSKAGGEKEILKALEKGLNAVIVNPTSVIGLYDFKPSHMGQLFLDLYNGKFPILIDAGFDWVDVRDVALGAMLAEKKGRIGERYILSGHYLKIKDLGLVIEKATGRKMPHIALPVWTARIGVPFIKLYSLLIGKRPLLTSGSLTALEDYRPINNKKAFQELGYEPRPIVETIKDTFDWFKKAGMIK